MKNSLGRMRTAREGSNPTSLQEVKRPLGIPVSILFLAEEEGFEPSLEIAPH